MKLFACILGLLSLYQLNSQFCETGNRFTNVESFTLTQLTSIEDTTYATALNVNNEMQSLEMDIYMPNQSIDNLQERPFILLIHGGGFYAGDKSNMTFECLEFAKRGFVTATMEYRLGNESDSGMESLKRSYRARQDGHAAIRFIVENATNLGIDTSWMFIGGYSAGTLLSLDLIYGEQSEWDLYFPSISAELGATNTSGNSLTHNFSLKGIYNNCGSATSLNVDANEMIPSIAFHKEYDHLVAIDSSNYSYGSRKLHELLEANNVCSQLTVDTVWYDSNVEGHCAYTDYQGTLTRVNKASCFFKNIFCNSCDNGYSEELTESTCTDLSISNFNTESKTNIFPSYTSGKVFISSNNLKEVKIYNTNGQLVISTLKTNSIDLNEFPDGIYYILLIDQENSIESHKIVKKS